MQTDITHWSLADGTDVEILQELGSAVWDIAEDDHFTVEDMRTALPVVQRKLDDGFFLVRVERCTDLELAYMRAMAELGPGPQKSGEVATTLGYSKSEELGPTRANLITKGLIVQQSLIGSCWFSAGQGQEMADLAPNSELGVDRPGTLPNHSRTRLTPHDDSSSETVQRATCSSTGMLSLRWAPQRSGSRPVLTPPQGTRPPRAVSLTVFPAFFRFRVPATGRRGRCVECWLPAYGPSCSSSPGRVQ